MTEIECIDRIDSIIIKHEVDDEYVTITNEKDYDSLRMAIKALEKDIPKKVKVEKWMYTECPSGCGMLLSVHHGDGYFTIEHESYRCPYCGQLLDWDE